MQQPEISIHPLIGRLRIIGDVTVVFYIVFIFVLKIWIVTNLLKRICCSSVDLFWLLQVYVLLD